jgi:hypothetical protein
MIHHIKVNAWDFMMGNRAGEKLAEVMYHAGHDQNKKGMVEVDNLA